MASEAFKAGCAKGGRERAARMTAEARSESARKAVQARWHKQPVSPERLAAALMVVEGALILAGGDGPGMAGILVPKIKRALGVR